MKVKYLVIVRQSATMYLECKAKIAVGRQTVSPIGTPHEMTGIRAYQKSMLVP